MTEAVTAGAFVPLTETGFGLTKQFAFGIAATGAQVSATDAENPFGPRLSWYVAVWPAVTVALAGEPEPGPMEKIPVPASWMV